MGNSSKGGTSLFSMLLILFITLKLTGVIDWSWWWVLAPFWVPLSLAVNIRRHWVACVFVCRICDYDDN